MTRSTKTVTGFALAIAVLGGCGDAEGVADMDPDMSEPDMQCPMSDMGTPQPVTIRDTDIAIVRLNADGTLDTTYGDDGITIVSLSTGIDTTVPADGAANTTDTLYNFDVDSTGRVVLFGAGRGSGARTDVDRIVARVLADGSGLDDTFGDLVDPMMPTGARLGTLNINIGGLNDNERAGTILESGDILSAGYTATPTGVGAQTANRAMVARIRGTNGTLDSTFGPNMSGLAQRNPFVPADPFNTAWGMGEAYGAAVQSNGRIVTTGYGRLAPSGQVNMISIAFTADGEYDTTWSAGDADGIDGTFEFQGDGGNDRGRFLVRLDDDRILIVGSGNGDADARIVVLDEDGELDDSFDDDGFKLYDFGFTAEHFFGAALSPDGSSIAVVGYRSGMMGGTAQDDDATLVILPSSLATGSEFAQAVPLSADAHDRFWWVTFDAMNRIVATGFADTDGDGDNEMAVARFNTNGTLDTTFGDGGIVAVNVFDAGELEGIGTTETARGVVVLPDGDILIAGPVEVIREITPAAP
jgi:uncharacterized delta-60 repeat protein